MSASAWASAAATAGAASAGWGLDWGGLSGGVRFDWSGLSGGVGLGGSGLVGDQGGNGALNAALRKAKFFERGLLRGFDKLRHLFCQSTEGRKAGWWQR